MLGSYAAIIHLFSFFKMMKQHPSVVLIFASEYTLLLALSIMTAVKFFLHLWDLRHDGRWDNKGVVLLYLEFGYDVCRLISNVVFALTIRSYYGMSFHIMRQLFLTVRSLRKVISSSYDSVGHPLTPN